MPDYPAGDRPAQQVYGPFARSSWSSASHDAWMSYNSQELPTPFTTSQSDAQANGFAYPSITDLTQSVPPPKSDQLSSRDATDEIAAFLSAMMAEWLDWSRANEMLDHVQAPLPPVEVAPPPRPSGGGHSRGGGHAHLRHGQRRRRHHSDSAHTGHRNGNRGHQSGRSDHQSASSSHHDVAPASDGPAKPVETGVVSDKSLAGKLVANASEVAREINKHGKCYAGVAEAVRRSGAGNLTGESAFMGADKLANNSHFQEIPRDSQLQPGDIIVHGPAKDNRHGHIAVYLGDGQEASSTQHELTSMNYGAWTRVFRPTG